MGKTISEKILAKAADRPEVFPGEIVEARIDLAMLHENTGTPAVMAFREIGLNSVWDPSRVVVIFDHNAPASTEIAAGLHKYMRTFVEEFKIGTFYDIQEGICHQVLPEKGHVLPGQLVVGVDSHTCTYGALGVFSTGIGSTDMTSVLATGGLWLKVPDTLKFVYRGKLPKGVSANLADKIYLTSTESSFYGLIGPCSGRGIEDGRTIDVLSWRWDLCTPYGHIDISCANNRYFRNPS